MRSNDQFFGERTLANRETFYGAGAINLSGHDWLGFGQLAQALGTGTESCGNKPICISVKKGSNCDKAKTAYNDCISKSVVAMQAQAGASIANEQRKAQEASRKRTMIIAVVSIVSIAIVVLGVVLIKRRNK